MVDKADHRRTRSSEGLSLLYSCNYFVFLQNLSFDSFRLAIPSEMFASLRSIHLHWQFSELLERRADWQWSEAAFNYELFELRKISRLDHLSVFVQGPLCKRVTYERILEDMTEVCHSRRPKFAVIRLPYPHPCISVEIRENGFWDLVDSGRPFRVVMPPQAPPTQPAVELGDHDMGQDAGWRVGVIFMPADRLDGSSEIIRRGYALWTPLPLGSIWPSSDSIITM